MSAEKQAKLPELQEADLDAETVEAYFRDLSECAEIIAVVPKMGPGYVSPSTVGLEDGYGLLRSGQVLGLQIRYRFDGAEWWDTLMVRNGVVRLVRIEQTFS